MINLTTQQPESPKCALDIEINDSIKAVSFLLIEDFLSDSECSNFDRYVNKNFTLSPGVNRENKQTENRYSDVSFIEQTPECDWLFKKIQNKILPINEKYQKYDLTHMDRLQYTRYKKDQYLEFHTDDYFDFIAIKDTGPLLLRKLSISIGLNDEYEGGEFEIQNFKGSVNEPYDIKRFRLKKRSAIVFPSFQLHKVHPVTSGERKAVVAWFFGPKWR